MITRDIVKVTPEMALKWLDGNTHNRTARQHVINRYARDMREGQWKLTHQGLAFGHNGTLLDGQMRLWAVVESKRTIEFEVTRGLDETAQERMDIGTNRGERDILTLRGEQADNTTIGMARILAVQIHGRLISKGDVVALFTRYADAIHWVAAAVKRVRGVRIAPVLTVILRAHISGAVPTADLLRFCQVLGDGVMQAQTDQPAVVLRNTLMAGPDRAERLYGKTATALLAFRNGKPIKNLLVATHELFPLPAETPTTKAPVGRGRVDEGRKRHPKPLPTPLGSAPLVGR